MKTTYKLSKEEQLVADGKISIKIQDGSYFVEDPQDNRKMYNMNISLRHQALQDFIKQFNIT